MAVWAVGGDWDLGVVVLPRVSRKVAMVLQFEREVTVVSWFKCEVAAVLRVNHCLVGSGWVVLPFFRFGMTTYNTDQLIKINTKLCDKIHYSTFITYSFPRCKSFSQGFRGVNCSFWGVNYSLILYKTQAAIFTEDTIGDVKTCLACLQTCFCSIRITLLNRSHSHYYFYYLPINWPVTLAF